MNLYEVIKEMDVTTKKSNLPDRIESHDECIQCNMNNSLCHKYLYLKELRSIQPISSSQTVLDKKGYWEKSLTVLLLVWPAIVTKDQNTWASSGFKGERD